MPDARVYAQKLPPELFRRLASFIEEEVGIKMPEQKRTLLETRLFKRLRQLEFSSFADYVGYVFSDEGRSREVPHLVDAVTTNKTDFFREIDHFDYLRDKVLPYYTERGGRALRFWSAAASSGEEAYTMAMVIEEYCQKSGLSIDYQILATDISEEILRKGVQAVYGRQRLAEVPAYYVSKYFMRHRDSRRPLYRVVPELRRRVDFRRLNLKAGWSRLNTPRDIIFCRNVLIYFDAPLQYAVLRRLISSMCDDGFLFMGHSESLHSLNLPLVQVSPSVYRKRAA